MQKFRQTALKLGASGHAAATVALAEADRRSKSGLGDAAGNVERFLMTLPLSGG
jgi:hypothetical protein